jgi:hypothetical protein
MSAVEDDHRAFEHPPTIPASPIGVSIIGS